MTKTKLDPGPIDSDDIFRSMTVHLGSTDPKGLEQELREKHLLVPGR